MNIFYQKLSQPLEKRQTSPTEVTTPRLKNTGLVGGPRSGNLVKNVPHLWHHSQKNCKPKPKQFFFHCRCEDLPNLL